MIVAGVLLLLASNDGWQTLGTTDGTSVEVKAPRVRASRMLPVPCEHVVTALEDVTNFARWVSLDAWTVVGDRRAAGGPLTMHGRHAMPFPFEPRDYVVDYVAQRDGSVFTLTAASVDVGPAPANGVVRLRVATVWRAFPVGTGCVVAYEYDGALGGSFPPFLLESIWSGEGPKLLAGLLAEARRRTAEAQRLRRAATLP